MSANRQQMKQNYDVLLFVHEDPRDFCRLAPWAINSLRLAHFFRPPFPHAEIVLSAASVCECVCVHIDIYKVRI